MLFEALVFIQNYHSIASYFTNPCALTFLQLVCHISNKSFIVFVSRRSIKIFPSARAQASIHVIFPGSYSCVVSWFICRYFMLTMLSGIETGALKGNWITL